MTYNHILLSGHADKAFFESIAVEVQNHCKHEGIALHSEILNLRSSQACCLNFLYPLRMHKDLAFKVLAPYFPNMESVKSIEFEYTSDADATTWLGKPLEGKRGQNRTSINAAVFWKTEKGESVCSLCQWQYTEPGFGTRGGYESKGNKNKAACGCLDLQSNPAANCYPMKKHSKILATFISMGNG